MADDKIPFTSHLEELRKRIFHSLIALCAAAVVGFFFSRRVLDLLTRSVPNLVFLAPAEAFVVQLKVALINGVVWGGLLGIIAWWLYGDWRLGVVMTTAMTLNLGLAAAVGVGIPMTLQKLGRDPAVGGSVMVTAVTDSGGFFIFLGLATLFLL